jgi:hypothetical protein
MTALRVGALLLDLPDRAYAAIGATREEYRERTLAWCHHALKLPASWDGIAALGRLSRPGRRHVRLLVADESRRPEIDVRYHPARVRPFPWGVALTIYHAIIVGWVTELQVAYGVHGGEGYCLVAVARVDEGPLGDAAWDAMQRRLLPAVSGTFVEDEHDPTRHVLLEVGVAVEGACPGARVLEAWEEPARTTQSRSGSEAG